MELIDSHQKAYVCVHVFDGQRPVLLVTRPDEDWCFLCGAEHVDTSESYQVIGIGHLLEHDQTLSEVLDLQEDWDAERTEIGKPWFRKEHRRR